MASERLSRLQTRRLAERAHRWVGTIKRINDPTVPHFDPSHVPWDIAADNVHMLALALEHLETCISLLAESGEDISGGRAFLQAWREAQSDDDSVSTRRASDLRNALEHEEEYVAGRGRNPALYSNEWLSRGMFESRLLLWNDSGISAIGFMGRTYFIQPAITAALDLEEPLLSLWDPPIEILPPGSEDSTDG